MFILGIILLILGYVLAIQILWVLGLILTLVGAVLLVAGGMGHPVGGRRWY